MGPGLLWGLSFFSPPRHNFLPVNWSVFASVSTPAQQHPPAGAIGSQFVPFLHVARSCNSSGFLRRCLRVIFALWFATIVGKLTRFPLWRSISAPNNHRHPSSLCCCLACRISAAHANNHLWASGQARRDTTRNIAVISLAPVGKQGSAISALRWKSRQRCNNDKSVYIMSLDARSGGWGLAGFKACCTTSCWEKALVKFANSHRTVNLSGLV